ncbi:hypothetical protein ACET3Z_016627 [Daucus carota]
MSTGKCSSCSVSPLTTLQIGDLQSYLSHLNLFLAPESKKFYILVDNRPWLEDLVSRPAHIWQLMVTKSRLSPFANTRKKKERRDIGGLFEGKGTSKINNSKSINLKKWFSVIDAASLSKKRALLPVEKLRNSLILNSKLHRTLYGFIVFEVAWSDVRGINYLNELQTDTSLAIEAKFMSRWEFESIGQAAKCISAWFSGTPTERACLKEHLECAIGDVFYDAQDFFAETTNVDDEVDETPCSPCSSFSVYPTTVERSGFTPRTPPPEDGPYKRRKVTSSFGSGSRVDTYSEEDDENFSSPIPSHVRYASDCEEAIEDTQYRDVLILFRFNDHDLPFRLKEIITSDLRLLTLLESGLPSWVIFFQSYPVFCKFYRPWMCPLVRALYVLISIVTVLIGFYDLYKNVPVLKAMASHFCGPLLDWIDTWEMVSRIKYLGTMLFLQNSQKAIEWLLKTSRTIRSFFRVLTQPVAGPIVVLWELLVPFLDTFAQVAESFCTLIWVTAESSFGLLESLAETVLLPLWFILSLLWNIVASFLYPIFWILWEILYAPLRLVLGICNLIVYIFSNVYAMIGDIWFFISSIFQLASTADATVNAEVSLWRTLWNDLFSQIFRAVRSILNGFVAFFAACNRHRLSIYNHVLELIQRLSQRPHRFQPTDSGQRGQESESPNFEKGKGRSTHHMKQR